MFFHYYFSGSFRQKLVELLTTQDLHGKFGGAFKIRKVVDSGQYLNGISFLQLSRGFHADEEGLTGNDFGRVLPGKCVHGDPFGGQSPFTGGGR